MDEMRDYFCPNLSATEIIAMGHDLILQQVKDMIYDDSILYEADRALYDASAEEIANNIEKSALDDLADDMLMLVGDPDRC